LISGPDVEGGPIVKLTSLGRIGYHHHPQLEYGVSS